MNEILLEFILSGYQQWKEIHKGYSSGGFFKAELIDGKLYAVKVCINPTAVKEQQIPLSLSTAILAGNIIVNGIPMTEEEYQEFCEELK